MQFSVSTENEGRSRCEFTMTVMHRIGIVIYRTSFKNLKQTRQKKMKSISGFTYVCVGLSVLYIEWAKCRVQRRRLVDNLA
jgi:hypothetical protein